MSPADQVQAAADGALSEPTTAADTAPVAFGAEWEFDFALRRFVRGDDGAPRVVRGLEGLRTWLGMATHTARGAHPVFTGEFGMDKPTKALGYAGADAKEYASDYGEQLRQAALVHERVTGISSFDGFYDPDAGLVKATWDLTTDADQSLRFEDLTLGSVD